jgi:hypothetical protein
MENTSRRNFMGTLVVGIVSSAIPMSSKAENVDSIKVDKSPTLEELKPGLQYAIKGYIRKWLWEDNLTQKDLSEIKHGIEAILYPIEQEEIVYSTKVIPSLSKDGLLNVKIGIQTSKESPNLMIWDVTIFHSNEDWA